MLTVDDSSPKLAIALGGGVARGWAHIGVLRILLANGIVPDIVCGTSIGAIVGGCYLAGKLDALETWARSLTRMRMLRYLDFQIGQPSLLAGDRLIEELRGHLDGLTIEQLDRPFAAVCADLATGQEVWVRQGPVVDAIRPSFAMPGVFPPVTVGSRMLMDGGLVNPVPVSTCRALGGHMVIGVNVNDLFQRLATPRPPEKTGFNLLDLLEREGSPIDGTGMGRLARQVFRREAADKTSIFEIMLTSLGMLLDRITKSRLAGDPPDVLIEPRISHIGFHEFDRSGELIEIGRKSAEKALPDILATMDTLGIPRRIEVA